MTITNHDHGSHLDSACCTPEQSLQEDAFASNLDSYCSVPTDRDASSAALDDIVEASATSPEVEALRSAGFRLLLDGGQPVHLDRWAAAAGVDGETLNEIIETSGAKGRVQFDADGSLVGIAGLTVEPTRHELNIDGTIRWTWCALDAVGILGALAATGTIRSTDPQTNAAVKVDFVQGEPNSGATLFILGGYDGGNVVEDWCPLVNFFATRRDAEVWVAAEGLEGDIVSASSVATQAAEMWRPVVNNPTPEVHRNDESTMVQQRVEGKVPHGH